MLCAFCLQYYITGFVKEYFETKIWDFPKVNPIVLFLEIN